MSITTFTLTVQNVGGSDKFFVDGVQQKQIFLSRGATYRFDDSDPSVSGNSLVFSTTPDGTHNGGSFYNTGTTRNNSPGQPGAYVEIAVAADAPAQLFYFSLQTADMGGSMLLAESNWGENSWGDNTWQSGVVIQDLDGEGFEATTSLGQVKAANFEGWGRQTWGQNGWGVEYTVELTGVSATTSLGTPQAEEFLDVPLTGLSATASVGDPNLALTTFVSIASGVSASTSVGVVLAQNEQGWGRDAWGAEGWGESFDPAPVLDGQQATASVGSLNPADVIGISGNEATLSLGTISTIGNVTITPTGLSLTSSEGSLSPEDVLSPTGQSATVSVGTPSVADTIGVSGFSLTSELGTVSIDSSPIVIPTGQSMTGSTGTLNPADVMGVTGLSGTFSIGSVTAKLDVSLIPDGQEATTTLAGFGTATGFGIQSFSDVDTGSNSSYTDVATGSNTSYTDAA